MAFQDSFEDNPDDQTPESLYLVHPIKIFPNRTSEDAIESVTSGTFPQILSTFDYIIFNSRSNPWKCLLELTCLSSDQLVNLTDQELLDILEFKTQNISSQQNTESGFIRILNLIQALKTKLEVKEG